LKGFSPCQVVCESFFLENVKAPILYGANRVEWGLSGIIWFTYFWMRLPIKNIIAIHTQQIWRGLNIQSRRVYFNF